MALLQSLPALLPLLLLTPGSALLSGASQPAMRSARVVRSGAAASPDARAALLGWGAGAAVALALLPHPAEASYAMYSASQDSFLERKATGYVPVATNDKASLAAIQKDIAFKRPQSAMKVKKAPQYCAGQMASVQPMMENICANIGISKADQSNTRVDAFGNMNVGQYSLDELETTISAKRR